MQHRREFRCAPFPLVMVADKINKGKNMSSDNSKVIGYFAKKSRINVICVEKDACLIAGSESSMQKYLIEIDQDQNKNISVSKARFGDIFKAMKLGARYAFDKESYSRFYPLGIKNKLVLAKANFNEEEGRKFFTVQIG